MVASSVVSSVDCLAASKGTSMAECSAGCLVALWESLLAARWAVNWAECSVACSADWWEFDWADL